MSLQLGFHYHIPAVKKDDALFTPGYQGLFIDSLAAYCERVVCYLHTATPEDESLCTYRLRSQNVEWVDLGLARSAPYRTLCASRFTRELQPARQSLDALLLRGPSPLLPAMAHRAKALPVALLLVGDYLAGVDALAQPRWRKEAIRLWAYWNYRAQLRVARTSLTFVNSRLLYAQLSPNVPNLVETRTTTLNLADLYARTDTCAAPPHRLLYTGRLSRSKGLLELVDALARLVAQGEDVILDLVGMYEKGEDVLTELFALAKNKNVSNRVFYHGYKSVGPELFSCYRRADIYVIASQSSEGFPRTIWEALAHSLPVVATRVGSIPAFLEGAAKLVTPRRADEIAAAIAWLLHHPQERQELIRRGMELVKTNTLEIQASKMVSEIERWAKN